MTDETIVSQASKPCPPCPSCRADATWETALTANVGGKEVIYRSCSECSYTAEYHDWLAHSLPSQADATSGEEMRLREDFAEAFDILVDVQSALVLTAEYSDGATVASFVSSSTQYDRLNKFLHSRQDADPRAALTKGADRHD